MGQIPEFSRTVLPQTAQYGLADVARQEGAVKAEQHRVKAAGIGQMVDAVQQGTRSYLNYEMQEAQARNATWVNENVINYKREASDAMEARRRERESNPKDFHKDFDKEARKLEENYLKQAPSEAARQAMRGSLRQIQQSFYDDNLSWGRQRQVSMFGESLDRTTENLRTLALRAGQEGKDIESLGLLRDVDASTVAGSTFVAPEKLEGMNKTMSRAVLGDYLEGLVENNPAKAREILKSKKYDAILGADELQRLDKTAEAEQKRIKAEAEAKMRLALSDEYDAMQEAMKAGAPLPAERFISMAGKLEAAGMEAEARRVRTVGNNYQAVTEFADLPLPEQQEKLTAMQATMRGGDISGAGEYNVLREYHENAIHAIQRDPWQFLSDRREVRPPAPIDWTQPAALAAELDQRRVGAAAVKQKHGITIPLMQDQEIEQLQSMLKAATPDQLGGVLDNLGKALSNDERRMMAVRLKDNDPIVAAALGANDPKLGEKIIAGSQIDGFVSKDAFRTVMAEKTKGAIASPVEFERMSDAAFALYKLYSYQDGDKATNIDGSRVKRAIHEMVGEPIKVGKGHILPPTLPGGGFMDEDTLRDTLLGLTDDHIKALGQSPTGGGVKRTADDIVKRMKFVGAGDGVYAAFELIGDKWDYIANDDGSMFLIDIRKMMQLELPPKPREQPLSDESYRFMQ